jgi:dolichol-phosphate mannosyltransferase
MRSPTPRTLVAIPVFNEERHVRQVLGRVLGYNENVLVIDDGSTDQTPRILPDFPVDMIRHAANRGYGKSLKDAFRFAIAEKYDWLITMDCDEQHEPAAIPSFIEAARDTDADIISGSRYLLPPDGQDRPPPERRAINATITAELNCRLSAQLGTLLTDSFCGFKAYRVSGLRKIHPTVRGYAFPMQFWVQAAAAGLKVRELPVRLIYNDLNRTFGAQLDDPEVRLAHYRQVLHREIRRQAERLPRPALAGVTEPHAAECCLEDPRRPEPALCESTRHECAAEPRVAATKPKAGCCRR